jgi:hypothetical protein
MPHIFFPKSAQKYNISEALEELEYDCTFSFLL